MVKPSPGWEDLANEIYPGLTAAIRVSGGGGFMDDDVEPRRYRAPDGSLETIRFGLRYVYSNDKMLLRIVTSASKTGGSWDLDMFNYVCGPDPYDHDTRYFAVDLHPPTGLHVHLPNDTKHLRLPAEVTPDVTNLRALDFVRAVSSFRTTKNCPFSLKGKP
jgi:hypothetical protein